MQKSISMILTSLATLSYLTGCGGNGSDPTIPKSVIKDIANNYTVARGGILNLDGSLSSDDVGIINYTWMIDDTIVSNSVTDALTVNVNTGSHQLCLTTEDEDGKSNKTCKTINIIATKATTTAIINNTPTSGWKTKCNITLTANASQAAFERTLTNYKWFKDGVELGNDINQTYAFNTTGEHNITLEVTDDQGIKDRDTKMVQIAEIGRPTAKLTLRNVENKLIFSDESNEDNKTWQMSDSDTNIPYKSNYVFFSAEGSYDDCNLTDDDLTFIWNASIYNANEVNVAPIPPELQGIIPYGQSSCFYNKSELRGVLIDFNGTHLAPITKYIGATDPNLVNLPVLDSNEAYQNAYKYPHADVVSGRISGWEGWKGWRDEKWEKVYASMCSARLNYTHLKVTLTVIDNLHDINTTVTKVVETRYTDSRDEDGNITDPNNPDYVPPN